MLRRSMLALPLVAFAHSALAQQTVAPQAVVDGAVRVIGDLRRDGAYVNAMHLLRQARGVLIVPTISKGNGSVVGGEGGNGLLMIRAHGTWSDPSFCAIGAQSFGFGLERSELLLLLMSQRSLDGMMREQFKISRTEDMTIAVLRAEVDNIGGSSPDFVLWSSSTGATSEGLHIDEALVRAQPTFNTAFYGQPVSARSVLFGPAQVPAALSLRREMSRIG